MGRGTPSLLTAGAILLIVAAVLSSSECAAAQAKRQSGLFQGFSGNSDQPINITSENLDAFQEEQKVVFTGNVVATQGDATLHSRQLTVYYEDSGNSTPAAKPAPGEGARAVKRLEAVGAVTVTSANQKAESNNGVFDIKANTADMTGNVVLTQGGNIVRSPRLHADLNTNIVRLNGGVRAHFVQERPPNQGPAKHSPAKRKLRRNVPLS